MIKPADPLRPFAAAETHQYYLMQSVPNPSTERDNDERWLLNYVRRATKVSACIGAAIGPGPNRSSIAFSIAA